MRLRALTWASDKALLLEAARDLSFDLQAWAISELDDENLQGCLESLQEGDVILLHPSQDPLFDRVLESLKKGIPVVSFGFDPALWSYSSVPAALCSSKGACS